VVVENWRMVEGGPGAEPDEQKAKIAGDIEKLNASAGWTKMLADKGWANTYLAGDAFATQLDADIAATDGVLRDIGLVKMSDLLERRPWWAASVRPRRALRGLPR
jgi:putative tricarboxylic transport membrane protein